jgi:hypothetical protein
MTAPDPSPARPLRVAGLALLGVAAVSLVIGLVSVFGGDGNGQADDATGTPSATASSTPAPETTETSGTTGTTTGSSAPATSSSPSAPPGTGSVPPGGDGNGEPGKTQQVRVFNNSTVGGLAGRAADELRESGWTVAQVGNYSGGVIPTTTVYYRAGTPEQSAAELLADEFGMRVEPRFEGISDFGPGLVVIVTGDYQGPGGERPPTEKNDQ